jgi:SPP1 gp7 family putative phage head morphogenesis protein
LDAFLDNRTSDICRKIDEEMKKGKKYRIDEAVVGENYPPLHPNCRTVALLHLT